MKLIEISFNTGDRDYDEALARAISERYKNVLCSIIGMDHGLKAGSSDDENFFEFEGEKIYRYQNLHDIVAEMSCIAGLEFQRVKSEMSDGIRIIGIAGVRGGIGCSSIAETVAEELKLYYGKSPMVVPMSFFGDEFACPGEISGERFLQGLLDGAVGASVLPRPDENGVFHLNFRHVNPLVGMKAGEAEETLERLVENTEADVLVVDFGAEYDPERLKLVGWMDKILAVCGKPGDEARAEKLKKAVRCVTENEEFDFDAVIMNCCQNETGGGIITDVIGYSPESFQSFGDGKVMKIDRDKEFGIEISRIIRRLLCEL